MPHAAPSPSHLPLVDGLRGYLIFAMTVGHFIAITGVTSLNFLTHKPFAVFLTGEGFMAVSGFMTGYVLTLGWARRGARGSMIWGLRRARKIVLHYLAVFALCAAPSLIWALEGSFAATLFHGRAGFSLADLGRLASGLYRPGFFDILYLYVLFIASAPLMLLVLRSRYRNAALALSLLAWLLTQYGVTQRAFAALFERLALPMSEAGSFHIFAWQMLFFASLALGATFAARPEDMRARLVDWQPALPLILTALAGFAAIGLASATGLVPLGLRYLEDYLIVAPLPLLNFVLASLGLALALNAPTPGFVARLLRGALRAAPLRDVGKVTLQSFSASIVLSYWVAYAVPEGGQLGAGVAWAGLAACLFGIWAVAQGALWLKQRQTGRQI